jgi:tyrosyl-tRNA synthetase
VHGETEMRKAVAASQALFGRGDLFDLDEATLTAAMAEAPSAAARLDDGQTIVDLLVSTGLAESKSAARRAIKEGGAYVNNTKVSDEAWGPTASDLLKGDWLVLRRGKRHTAGVRLVR